MTVFYHHVGDENAKRDFPRTIGSSLGGLVRFSAFDIGEWLPDVEEPGSSELRRFVASHGSAHFQAWGIPAGAADLFERVVPGDYWMLLDTPGHGGGLQYIGKVDFKVPGYQLALSRRLWTETRFPLIFLMHGVRIYMPWEEFLKYLGYSQNYDPRGRVFGIAKERLAATPTPSDESFVDFVVSTYSV